MTSIVKAYPTRESPRRSREGGNLASPAPCLGVGAVREPPEGHATSNVPPNPNDNSPLPHSCTNPYIGLRHSSEGWNPACATAERTRGGGAEGLCARFLSPAGPLALWERVRVRAATNDNCPLPHGCPNPYIGHIRRSHESRRHSSEGWNPACATAERTRGGGAEGLCPRFLSPQKPRIPGFCRPNQRQLHITPSPRQPLHWSPSFPCRREPRIPCPCLVYRRFANRPKVTPPQTYRPTNDNCPLRRRRPNPYIGSIRRSREPRRHSSEGWNPACATAERTRGGGEEGLCPRFLSSQKPPRMRVRRKGNATELKVSPLLATSNEATRGHNQGRLAHSLRVSRGPNEATVAPFPASQLGVNRAKQGQMGPGFTPSPIVPCRREIPSPSGRGSG